MPTQGHPGQGHPAQGNGAKGHPTQGNAIPANAAQGHRLSAGAGNPADTGGPAVRGRQPARGEGSRDDRGDRGVSRSKPGATAGEGRSASSVAQIAMAVLFVLAIVATIVMVFSNNDLWMRIGLLAALWSALVGALLVARDRRAAQQAAEREADLKRVHALELESEVAARREGEHNLREELREELRAEHDESLESLRVEVVALRSQLEQLGVQPIVDGSRSVDAGRRAQELAGATGPASTRGDSGRTGGFPYGAEQAPGRGDDHERGQAAEQAHSQDQAHDYDRSSGDTAPAADRASHAGPAGAGANGGYGRGYDDAGVHPAPIRVAGADSTPSTEVTSSMPKFREDREAPARWGSPQAEERRSPFVAAGFGAASTPHRYGSESVPEPARESETIGTPEPARTPEPVREPESAREPDPAPAAEQPVATGPGTDRFSSFESFRLSAPPSFAEEAELPDFDAPTGFELSSGAAPSAGWGVAPTGGGIGGSVADADPFAGTGWGNSGSGTASAAAHGADTADTTESTTARRHGGAHEAATGGGFSLTPADEPRPGRRRKPDTDAESANSATEEPRPGRRRKPEPDADVETGAGARSRHGSAEGTSVADLLARFGEGSGEGSAGNTGGGRRRRKD